MFLDDSACNLASFNLLKFLTPGGQFDIASLPSRHRRRHHRDGDHRRRRRLPHRDRSPRTRTTIARSASATPTSALCSWPSACPYDSDAGRDFAATLTSILCGDAYWQSSRIAEPCPPLGAATPLTQQAHIAGGACPGFYVNREPFLDVIRMHRAEVNNIGSFLRLARALRRSAARRAHRSPPRRLGRRTRPRRNATATATPRSPSSPPPAPSAS